LLAVALLTVTACSSGGDSPTADNTSPDKTDKTSTQSTEGPNGKLVKLKGKDDLKNAVIKTDGGGKVSLSAKSPGHELMLQVYNPDTESWGAPTSVFKDDTRFCHSIKVKHERTTIAATVQCSISGKDKEGTQSSYVLASSDGKTWKRMDLPGADGKPILSPLGNVVAWSSPTSFLLWNAKAGTFKAVKYTQDPDSPTVAVLQNNGVLVMVKAAQGGDKKSKGCVFSFLTASATAPIAKPVNSTLPQQGHPQCTATSAKLQGAEIIGNFESTTREADSSGKKVTKTTPFAVAFAKLPTGRWIVKTA